MANKQKNPASQDEAVADYSGFFKKDQPQQKRAPQKPVSPLQELPATKWVTKRTVTLLVIMLALLAVQAYLFFSWQEKTHTTIPDGYELVTPPNQPAYIQPIK